MSLVASTYFWLYNFLGQNVALKKPFSILDLLLKKEFQNEIGLFFSKLIVAV